VITYEEAGVMLDEIAAELPEEFYKDLNGGVILLTDEKVHPESGDSKDLYIMGEYHNQPHGLGRFITIYFGSFIRIHSHLSPEQQKIKLRRIVRHEFTHHLESLAGERELEKMDEQDMEKYRRRKQNGNRYSERN